MINFSSDIYKAIYNTNGGFVEISESCHQKFLANDRSALMSMLMACALYQEVIPAWVADELLTIDKQIANVQFRDMNDFFNFGKPLNIRTLEFLGDVKTKNNRVLEVFFRHKVDGSELQRHELREIAKELGVSQKVVTTIYNDNREWLDQLPTKIKKNSGYMQGELPSLLELAIHKRTT